LDCWPADRRNPITNQSDLRVSRQEKFVVRGRRRPIEATLTRVDRNAERTPQIHETPRKIN
jgi:hypothetical protein